jgi:DNA-binding transcriptional ArsR family regulator
MRPLRTNLDQADHVAEKMKALGHPLRLRIVAILSETETNVSTLAEELGVAQSAVSQHLRILRMENLVSVVRKDGFATYKNLEPRLSKLLDCLEECRWR